MARSVFFSLLFVLASGFAFAQAPLLPDIAIASDKGVNVLSWTCQYDGIKSIAVQRSSDSVFNYTTVGYVRNLKKGQQAFIDGHPQAGDNWYRLYIGFSSDLTWYSNTVKVHIDSATLLNKSVIPPNDSLQKYASSINLKPEDIIATSNDAPSAPVSAPAYNQGTTTPATRPSTTAGTVAARPAPKLELNIPKSNEVNQYTYVKSRHVFTNPFTGHVTLELPEDSRKIYAIQFFKQGDERTPVLDVPRLRKSKVVIDKRNFQGKGVYKFVLYEGTNKMDEGYISIF